MLKYELVPDGSEYARVADRITLFYERYPTGRILTWLLSRTEQEITVQAFVFRSLAEQTPSATGLASERIGNGDINTVACLENTETSAIGRALANLGLTASPHRPSREEIEKAERERRVAEPRPPFDTRQRGDLTMQRPRTDDAVQRRANRVMDALDLLWRAERAGLPPKRARRIRDALTAHGVSDAIIERVERLLRTWTAARDASHLRL